MSTITLTRKLESETLHLPELRPFVGHRVEIVVRDSEPTAVGNMERGGLFEALEEVWQKNRQPNWDNEGADAISTETRDVAHRLLTLLPSGIQAPSISAEPDGQLSFEWFQAPRRLLSVSVSSSGTLYWAALIGSEDPRGSCQLGDQFPQTLLYWIGQVYG